MSKTTNTTASDLTAPMIAKQIAINLHSPSMGHHAEATGNFVRLVRDYFDSDEFITVRRGAAGVWTAESSNGNTYAIRTERNCSLVLIEEEPAEEQSAEEKSETVEVIDITPSWRGLVWSLFHARCSPEMWLCELDRLVRAVGDLAEVDPTLRDRSGRQLWHAAMFDRQYGARVQNNAPLTALLQYADVADRRA